MTSKEVNALPKRVKDYIHDLETRCDPNGEVRELWYLREQNRQLVALIIELMEEHHGSDTKVRLVRTSGAEGEDRKRGKD